MTSTPSSVRTATRQLLLGGEFSDMDIICQGVIFKAHKAIVCTQSEYFRKAFFGYFKESIDKTITLQDETPETIERVLSFLYLGEYNGDGHILPFQSYTDSDSVMTDAKISEDKADAAQISKNIAFNHIRVYVAADKYIINPLKSLVTAQFSEWSKKNWQSPIFPEVIKEVITSLPPHDSSLQEVIAKIYAAHISNMIRNPIMLGLMPLGKLATLIIVELWKNKQITQPDALENFAKKLGSARNCRQCNTKFNVELKSLEIVHGVFRCTNCNTRN